MMGRQGNGAPQARSPRSRESQTRGYVMGNAGMDSVLLALCFVAMAVLVLAWTVLPHSSPALTARVQRTRAEAVPEAALKPSAA